MIYTNKKTLAIVLTLGVIASVGYFGTTQVLASGTNPMYQNLISRIAQKFNLNESDVEAVFNAVKDERLDDMKKAREEKLSQAVKDGVITEAQKALLLAKFGEHIKERGLKKEDMQKWFRDNGIDEVKLQNYLRPKDKEMRNDRGRFGIRH